MPHYIIMNIGYHKITRQVHKILGIPLRHQDPVVHPVQSHIAIGRLHGQPVEIHGHATSCSEPGSSQCQQSRPGAQIDDVTNRLSRKSRLNGFQAIPGRGVCSCTEDDPGIEQYSVSPGVFSALVSCRQDLQCTNPQWRKRTALPVIVGHLKPVRQ